MKKRFCHQCGTHTALDAAFCEECGTELRPSVPAHTPLPLPPPTATHSTAQIRKLLIAGGVAAVFAASGGIAWFALSGKPATEPELKTATEAWLTAAGRAVNNRPCLQNFNYQANPVLVNPGDNATIEWLAPLVKAGIYLAPTEIQTANSWQPVKLRYAKGPEAPRHISGDKLCAASELQVTQVSFDPQAEVKLGEVRMQQGAVKLAWQDRAAWSEEAPLKSAFDSLFADRTESIVWAREKNGWRVASDSEKGRWRQDAARVAQGKTASTGRTSAFSFGGFFSELFSFGDPPEKSVEKFFRSLERGDAKAAADLIDTGEVPKEKLLPLLAANSTEIAMRGGISRIDSTDQGGSDNIRRVQSRITYNNGRSETRALDLRKVDGRWLLDLKQ